MLVNFLLMCLSVLLLPRRNPDLARRIQVARSAKIRVPLAAAGAILLAGLLGVHIWKDFSAAVDAWYFRSTWIWLVVMAVASVIFWREMRQLKRSGADVAAIFDQLPPE